MPEPRPDVDDFATLRARLHHVEATWYPALLRTLVEQSYAADVWQPGGASRFVQAIEERLGVALLRATTSYAAAEGDMAAAQERLNTMKEETGGMSQPESLTFEQFARVNWARCESPRGFNHRLWSLSDWITAVLGELGEAANIAKKLNRVRDGIPGNTLSEAELRAAFRREIGDVFVYLDLIAQSQGFRLEDAAREVFNAKSAELGMPFTL
jgi:NTP pyrophosphatase (non-canonical NTP hydrolase)